MKFVRKWGKLKASINNFFSEGEKTSKSKENFSTLEKKLFFSLLPLRFSSAHLRRLTRLCRKIVKISTPTPSKDSDTHTTSMRSRCLWAFLIAFDFQPLHQRCYEYTDVHCTTSTLSSDCKSKGKFCCFCAFWTHLNFHSEYKHCRRAFSLDMMAQSPCPDR